MSQPPAPWPLLYDALLRRALREDLGRAGDLTTDAIVPQGQVVQALIFARVPGRVAGVPLAGRVFQLLDPTVTVSIAAPDGCDVDTGALILSLEGSARAILTAERTALNILGRLSGIATATRDIVAAVAGSRARVVCTRKTTPGLRSLEKYAVRVGGGANHRFGLDDAVLIKDNHLAVAGSISEAVARVRRSIGHLVKIEVEVETLAAIDEALVAGVDAILLDNFSLAELAQAVRQAAGRAITEASGNIRPATAAAIASTGVDLLSVGWLTHSAPALDVSLSVTPPGPTGL